MTHRPRGGLVVTDTAEELLESDPGEREESAMKLEVQV